MDNWLWLEDLGSRGTPPPSARFAAYASNDAMLFRHGGCAGSGRTHTAGVSGDLYMYHIEKRRWGCIAASSSREEERPPTDVILQRAFGGEEGNLLQRYVGAADDVGSVQLHCSTRAAPVRYHHLAMTVPAAAASSSNRGGGEEATLLLHGGRSATGKECNELWCFQLSRAGRGCWRSLDAVACGAQPPTMYGHRAALLNGGNDEGDVTWAVVGLVGSGAARERNYKRDRSPHTGGASSRARRGFSTCVAVYTLTYGASNCWKELWPCNNKEGTAGSCPTPRRDFLLSTGRPAVAAAASSLGTTTAPRHLILVGGMASHMECNDVWLFDLQISAWQEVKVAQGPLLSGALSNKAPFWTAHRSKGALTQSHLIPLHQYLDQDDPVSLALWLCVNGQRCSCLLWRRRSGSAFADQPVVQAIPLAHAMQNLSAGLITSQLVMATALPPAASPLAIVHQAVRARQVGGNNNNNADSSALPGDVTSDERDLLIGKAEAVLGGLTASGRVIRMEVTRRMLEALECVLGRTRLSAPPVPAVSDTVRTATQLQPPPPPPPPPEVPSVVQGCGGDDENLLDDLFD